MHSKNQKRHGSPLPSRSPLVPMKPKAPAVAPAVAASAGDTLAFRVPKEFPHSRFSKAPLAVYPPKGARNKTCVSLPVVSLEKMPCLSRGDPTSHVRLTSAPSSSSSCSPSTSVKPASLTPPASQRSGEKLTNGRGSGSSSSSSSGPSTPRSATPPSSLDRRPSPSRSPLDRRPSSSTPSPSALDRKPSPSTLLSQRSGAVSSLLSSSPLEKKQQNGTKASSKSHRRLTGRVFDPNKHCGVQDPETKRPCTRSLTCKTHSLTHRRAVPGRRKQFNVLLAEHKGRAKEKEKEKDGDGVQAGKEGGCGPTITTQESPSKPNCPNGRPLSALKLRLASAHIPRVPGGYINATSSSVPPAPAPAVAANPELSPLSWVTAAGDSSRVSSDEGEAETPDDTDRPAVLYSNHHPQPLGFCVYSSRLMGRGHYVFDRRWDRMRLVLQSMVEKHLNAQMWRKVPLADSLLPASSSGTSSVISQQTSSPASVASPLLTSGSDSPSCTAASSQTTSAAGTLGVREAPQAHAPATTPGKARNGAHKTSRPSKDKEDSDVGSKKRKNSSFSSSSSLCSAPSLFLTVDNHKRNGISYHSTLQSSGAAAFKKKELERGGGSGLWHGGDDWLSRSDGSQSLNSQSSRSLGSTGLPYTSRESASAAHQPLAPPSAPLAYGGGVEGRKRRSPSSYRGKTGKLSKPGDLESLFGKGNDIGGILTYGPESPRQAKLHH